MCVDLNGNVLLVKKSSAEAFLANLKNEERKYEMLNDLAASEQLYYGGGGDYVDVNKEPSQDTKAFKSLLVKRNEKRIRRPPIPFRIG
jgi:hypothetical protein